ncbi:MAG: UDP-N-acetylmuramyl-tripeptide synthetase [Candidatus Falkowbacteria bacterium]
MEKILNTIKKIIPKKLFKKLQPAYHFSLSWFSAFWYRHPSEKLIIIGVTGTTGKTTSVYLIAKMLEDAGYKTGYTSTAMFNDGKKEWLNDKKMTMPGRFFTQKILRDMIKNNCKYAVVETTSEGIKQFRHKFINYDILVFTGLYPEHIESHGSFENYKKAKGELFKHLEKCGIKYSDDKKIVKKAETGIKKIDLNKIKKTIIVNGDDEHFDYFLKFRAEEKLFFTKSLKHKKIDDNIRIIKYGDIEADATETVFYIDGIKIGLKLLGEFNAVNAMTAVCVGLSQNLTPRKIKKGLESIKGVPGRFERIDAGQEFSVIADYAFEPNAVDKLYETIKLFPSSRDKDNKIIHVLGSAGGGRDKARRPELGKIAGKNADFVIVTNEDPYDEDPMEIINQVAEGAEKQGKKEEKNLFKILDRKEAIKKALSLANEKDIVLITGKGSEQAICVRDGKKIAWDDRKIARELINML